MREIRRTIFWYLNQTYHFLVLNYHATKSKLISTLDLSYHVHIPAVLLPWGTFPVATRENASSWASEPPWMCLQWGKCRTMNALREQTCKTWRFHECEDTYCGHLDYNILGLGGCHNREGNTQNRFYRKSGYLSYEVGSRVFQMCYLLFFVSDLLLLFFYRYKSI